MKPDRASRLQAHIDAVTNVPIEWGRSDCSPWAGAWVEGEIGRSLGLPAYSTEQEGKDRIAAAGGLDRLWAAIASRAGLWETGAPALGDVGVIETKKFGDVGVIFALDGICAMRTTRSVMFLRPRHIIRAWRV